jgi:6-pyruvoyltetrahydropterin/6-carboxytetrahydropterin synthase
MTTTLLKPSEATMATAPRQSTPPRAQARFELSQRFYFEAAHTLRRSVETEGSLRIHGHTYESEVTVQGVPDSDSGMIMDLAYLRSEIARLRELLDHCLLDEVTGLGPPTLENLCGFIRMQLEDTVPGLSSVMVERKVSGDRCLMRWDR